MAAPQGQPPTPNFTAKTIGAGMILLKHWRLSLLLFLLSLAAGLAYYVFCKPVYYAKSLVKFNIVNLPVHSASAGENTPFYRLRRALFEDFQSRHLIERTAVRLGLVNSTGSYQTVSESFIKEVKIEPLDEFKFTIMAYPYSPEIAEVWSEAMVAEYRDYQAELRMEYNVQAVETYTRELAQIRERMLESLQERLDFENKSSFAESSLEAAEYNRILTDLFMVRQQLRSAEQTEQAIASTQLDPLELIHRLALFGSEIKSHSEPVVTANTPAKGPVQVTPIKSEMILLESGAATTTLWEDLREKEDTLLAERDEAAKKYLPGHEKMIAINESVSLLQKRIKLEAQAALESFHTQVAKMRETEKALVAKLPAGREATAKLSKSQLEFQMMQTQLPWEKAYADVQQKLQSLDFGAGKERILIHHEKLDQVNRTPVSPNKMKLLLAACAVGAALAFGIPFGLTQLNDTASKLDDLEHSLNVKGLGIVPMTSSEVLEDIVRNPAHEARIPNSLLESFRVIRSGITLNEDAPDKSKVTMVTSARPSEGKTVISCNLGWAFASIDVPTLLIDSDLRRGRVHKVLDLPNEKGLSNVLMGEADLDAVIQPTRVHNLWALTRGTIIPGASEKLCIPEHEQRLAILRRRFSRIIMDTPPVLGLSETGALMRLVDGVVLVVRAERTTYRDVRQAMTILDKVEANVHGFILNRLDLNQLTNSYHYYYYSSYYENLPEETEETMPKDRPGDRHLSI